MIEKREVDKQINDAIIANSILVIFFSGILLSLSFQHLITVSFIYLEAAILVFAAIVVFSHGQKLIFTSLVLAVYAGFMSVVIWSVYSMYMTGDASIFGIVVFVIIPAYIFYLNIVAFTGLLKYKLQIRKSKASSNQ